MYGSEGGAWTGNRPVGRQRPPPTRRIGWNAQTRRKHLHRVINLSRFLLRPCVRCHNLASRVLGMALRRIGDDFELRYGYRPWLVESFVDQSRHTGTCYQASNWIEVGQTQGRGRQDSAHQHAETVKAIYLYPLESDFRSRMGIELPVREARQITEGLEGEQWAHHEFGGAQLGDERLSKRLVECARIQAEKPGEVFSGAAQGNWAPVEGLLSNDRQAGRFGRHHGCHPRPAP